MNLTALPGKTTGTTCDPSISSQVLGRDLTSQLLDLNGEWIMFANLFLGLRRQVKTVREIIDEKSWTSGDGAYMWQFGVGTALAWMVFGFVVAKALRLGSDGLGKLRSLYLTALWKRRYGSSFQSAPDSAKNSSTVDICSSNSPTGRGVSKLVSSLATVGHAVPALLLL
jgi:hypothetical protein